MLKPREIWVRVKGPIRVAKKVTWAIKDTTKVPLKGEDSNPLEEEDPVTSRGIPRFQEVPIIQWVPKKITQAIKEGIIH